MNEEHLLKKIEKMLIQIKDKDNKVANKNYIYNIKMSCLRPQWTLFENEDIIITANLSNLSVVTLQIGNKNHQYLEGVNLIKNGHPFRNNEVMKGKSYLTEPFPPNVMTVQLLNYFSLTYVSPVNG